MLNYFATISKKTKTILQSIATGIEFGVFSPYKILVLLVQKNLYHLDYPKDDSSRRFLKTISNHNHGVEKPVEK